MQEERFWNAKETNKKTSFYSTSSDWYSSSQTAQNVNAWHLLYTREPLWDTHWTAAPAHLALNKALRADAAAAGHLPYKTEKQLQPPVPHTPPLATGTIPTTQGSCTPAGSSTCMDAQRSHRLHRLTNLPWLESRWERWNDHPLQGMLWEGVCTCLAVQMPSLPQRSLLWIIWLSSPVEELAPSGTGIISLQCTRVSDSSPQIFGYSQP